MFFDDREGYGSVTNMGLRKIVSEVWMWITLVQCRVQCRTFGLTVLNPWILLTVLKYKSRRVTF
jgi:hypothetical protein